MYESDVLRFALVSGLIGFSAFCISYACLVWRRRNTEAAGQQDSPLDALRRWSVYAVFVGVFAIGASAAVRELNRVQGVLSADGVCAVRAPDDEYRITHLAEGDSVKEGEVIARLASAEAEARVKELELQGRRLEREREALQLEPLALDGELVRHHQNAMTKASQLRMLVGQLLPEYESLVRSAALERLSRLESIAKLDVEIGWSKGEFNRASGRHSYAGRDLSRTTRLMDRGVVSESETDLKQQQAQDLLVETANLKQRIAGLQTERTQITESLNEISLLTEEQQKTLQSELRKAEEEWSAAEAERLRLAVELEEDAERARKLRDRELEQRDLKIQECQAQCLGTEKTLTIRAPFDGSVAFRDPSPMSAEKDQPILVLAAHPGFRLQVRLPASQVAALKEAGEVRVKLTESYVEPYFAGRLLDTRSMPHLPKYVIAELVCRPSDEAIRDVIDGERVQSVLQWRPPLATLLPFQAGAVLALAGLAGWGAACTPLLRGRRSQRRNGGNGYESISSVHRRRNSRKAAVEKSSDELPAPTAAELESGAIAALHELLGERLREVILRDEIDTDLLAAVEWALDRHHVRAVQHMRVGLGFDSTLEEKAGRLRQQVATGPKVGRNGYHQEAEHERVLRVLRTIDPRLAECHSSSC